MDMFLQAGVLWNVTMGAEPSPKFDVKIVTSDGGPVMALNQVPVIPACAMHDIENADVISGGYHLAQKAHLYFRTVSWLSGPGLRLAQTGTIERPIAL